jgi:hypothetical protein
MALPPHTTRVFFFFSSEVCDVIEVIELAIMHKKIQANLEYASKHRKLSESFHILIGYILEPGTACRNLMI